MVDNLFIAYLRLAPHGYSNFTRSMQKQNPFLECNNHFGIFKPVERGFYVNNQPLPA